MEEQKRYIHKKSKRLCHTCGSWEYYDKYYCGHGAFICLSCNKKKKETKMETEQETKWNDKQKKAFIEIQNRIYNEMGLTNLEVAEMHTLKDKNEVFALFQFQTSKWLNEFAWKDKHKH